jgi:DNA primase
MQEQLDYSKQELLDYNIISENEKGVSFDKIRNSITITTVDLNKKVVCIDRFSLNEEKIYHYPKSENFARKEYVYSLNIAINSGYNSIILVSSYEDYFALYSQGFSNVAYTYLGKVSFEQLSLLKKYFKIIIPSVPSHFDYRPCIEFCRKNNMYCDIIDIGSEKLSDYFSGDRLTTLRNKINEFNKI